MRRVTRRDFLKKSGRAGLALAGGLSLETLLDGCAGISTELVTQEEAPVIYPPLKGHKVQPPDNGCLVGFFRHYMHNRPNGEYAKDTTRVVAR